MALTDPKQARTTDYSTAMTSYVAGQEPWNLNLANYQLDRKDTEAFTYQADWSRWHGLYRTIPELRSTIDTESYWMISKEITMDAKAKEINKKLRTSLREVLIRHLRTSMICGDSYAWIPRDKAGRLLNIKILDPGTIEIQADKFGIIQKYVQIAHKGGASKADPKQAPLATFTPKEIFHLSNEPIADEIHGIPQPESMQKIIKMFHQTMDLNQLIIKTYAKPTYFFHADTDDEAELAEIQEVLNKVKKNFEDALFPKGALDKIEKVSTPQFGSIDVMPWLKFKRSYFTESSGVPDIMRGKSDEVSLAAGKLNMVAYKEKIIMKQMNYEEKIEKQLKIKVGFERPIEIDIEISRTDEDMALKESAKKQKGGDQVVSGTKRSSEKK